MNRRELVKGAAWAVPVIAAAVAVPMHAASEPTGNRIRFTNLTATVGGAKNTVYANTKVQVVDGPEQVHGVLVTITMRQGETVFTHTQSTPVLPGWGGTEIFRVEQGGFMKGAPIDVFFTATAVDGDMITGHVVVEAPRWWT